MIASGYEGVAARDKGCPLPSTISDCESNVFGVFSCSIFFSFLN